MHNRGTSGSGFPYKYVEARMRGLVWGLAAMLLFGCAPAALASAAVKLPKLAAAPKLEDFEGMAPHGAATQMARVEGFIQQQPSDGKPATQRTDAYLGYDHDNLYIVFLCWDNHASAIRGHLSRREPATPFDTDDYVEITLDTFHDQRHGFVFDVNPLGVQADALYSENGNPDYSWDTLWYSRTSVNGQGYVVWVAIPFRSLRFRLAGEAWGFTLMRYIAREDEDDYWPQVSSRIAGRLNQEATLSGFDSISPGRNLQFIPYAEGRTFRALDTRDPVQPRFSSCMACGKAGLDTKMVFQDRLVLDATLNPDFAQVESDEPQNTINQRFEVFFPEKRPFFLENANFFDAPLIAVPFQTRLLFTRRIADPTFGTRLTGKEGPWNLGFMVADDRSPGEVVPDNDPAHGKRAYFAIGRISHDLGKHSMLGAIYTDREFQGQFNRVGGLDGLWYINQNWTSTYRGYLSSTREASGYLFGQHHEAVIHGTGRRFTFDLQYLDITPNFRTETGFVQRVDQRALNQYAHFYWRPEGKHLVFHGPEQNTTQMWDHHGTTVQQVASFDYVFGFRRNIIVAPILAYESDVLRPVDFPGLPRNRQYVQDAWGIVFRGHPWRFFSWNTKLIRDGVPVVVPAPGQLPFTGDEYLLTHTFTVVPTGRLQVDNTYILDNVRNGRADHAAFNNHIFRTKWNYQFTREFSLRLIGQYNALLANPQFSSLHTTKNLNFDVLFTYLLHPGTAIYVGYNTNLENIAPGLCTRIAGATECDPNGSGLVRTPNHLINDGRQFFVKVSYLFRR